MFLTNLRLAFRNLRYHGLSTFINILGLVAGLTAAIFVLLFILNELSYDKQHKNNNRIYRVTEYNHTHKWMMATTPYQLAEAVKEESPAVEKAVRIERVSPVKILNNQQWIIEEDMYSCGPEVFDIFTFPLLFGTARELAEPNTAILTEKSALKYFDTSYPVDSTFKIQLGDTTIMLKVVGIMKDPPVNLTFRPEIIVSEELGLLSMSKSLITTGGPAPSLEDIENDWNFNFFTSYLMLYPNSDTAQVFAAFRSLEKQYYGEEVRYTFHLQPLKEIYLVSGHLINAGTPMGDRQTILIFIGIGLLILAISLGNYILLYSGQTISRSREFGLRRIAGATGRKLLNQVILETMLIVILVLPLCFVLIELLRPAVSASINKKLVLEEGIYWQYLLGVAGITVLLGSIPGISMISYVTSIRPVSLFKVEGASSKGRISLRGLLIFCQFIIFNILIISGLGIYKQVRYPFKKDLGFRWKNLVKVRIMQTGSLDDKFEEIKNELENINGIISISGGMFIPPTNNVMSINIEKLDGSGEKINLEALFVDKDFIETMGIKLLEGQSFSEFSSGDRKILLNRKAMDLLGTEDPLGEKLMGREIVGIVDDFNTHTMDRNIPGTLIISSKNNMREMIIRIDPRRATELKELILASVRKFYPDSDPEIITFEEELKNMYRKERIIASAVGVFTVIALIIGAMGLFGASMYMIQKRRKEFAIRKVNGARIGQIIQLLARNYLILILSSLALATPVSIYILNRWLRNFVYRTSLSWWIFAISGAVGILIVSVTAGIHIIRAARTNPAKSLRYE
jgi:putative ABC transport system permease protein